jgi:glycosyltransferase involved in cell wall biosynthesis
MRISIFSLFRDSESYIKRALKQFNDLEKNTDAEFSYYFYENDSADKTPSILKRWMSKKDGALKCDKINNQSFGSDLRPERMIHLSKCRNLMQALDDSRDSDFTAIVDSDVIFSKSIINQFLKYTDLDFSMLTSNIRQDIPCKMGSGKPDSYYDSSILVDKHEVQGMTWSYNPFYEPRDRDLFNQNKPIEVTSAFGSFAFLRTETFHKCKWNSNGESEHFSFCRDLNRYGKIYLIPEIQPLVEVDQKNFPHETEVIKTQKWLSESKWNRFLWKSGSVRVT